VPSRELQTVSFCTNVIVLIVPPAADTLRTVKKVLASARTVKGVAVVIFYRSRELRVAPSRELLVVIFLSFEGYCPRTTNR